MFLLLPFVDMIDDVTSGIPSEGDIQLAVWRRFDIGSQSLFLKIVFRTARGGRRSSRQKDSSCSRLKPDMTAQKTSRISQKQHQQQRDTYPSDSTDFSPRNCISRNIINTLKIGQKRENKPATLEWTYMLYKRHSCKNVFIYVDLSVCSLMHSFMWIWVFIDAFI